MLDMAYSYVFLILFNFIQVSPGATVVTCPSCVLGVVNLDMKLVVSEFKMCDSVIPDLSLHFRLSHKPGHSEYCQTRSKV